VGGGAGSTGGDAGTGTGNGNGTGNGSGGSATGADAGTGNGNGNGSTHDTGSSSDGSGAGGNGVGNGNGSGTGSGDGSGNGGASAGGGSGAGGGGGPGIHGSSTCVESGGVTTCREKTPECAPGTKPAPCGACVPASSDGGDCTPPAQGGCWITGGGWVAVPEVAGTNGKATFGGNGKPMKSGSIQGEWNHVDHTGGGHIHGEVRYLVCRHVDEPGPGNPSGPKHDFDDNQAYFGGPARFSQPNGAWADGYWFDAFVEDHGEPGNKPGPGNHGSKGPDEYHIVLRKQADPTSQQSGTIVYEIHEALPLGGGNIQLHPPNNGHPATASSLPAWVSLEP
jgi:hypothetical protein